MKDVKHNICSNASTDEERFELIKREAEINQGELSYGNKVAEFVNNTVSLFSKSIREKAKEKISEFVNGVVESFKSKAVAQRGGPQFSDMTLSD
ncbi:hypothetical protein [Vibrio alfacsensis]|uniref:hypothetical protein n=1 Tax=Vibrio alfacsensis TaxID=1074311 RepID=UPI00406762A1